MESIKSLNVVTSDGATHSVPIDILNKFGMIKTMLETFEDDLSNEVIPLKQVSSECLQLILSWIIQHEASQVKSVTKDVESVTGSMKRLSIEQFNHQQQVGFHFGSTVGSVSSGALSDVGVNNVQDRRIKVIPAEDVNFINSLTRKQVFELLIATNYLECELLFQYLCKTVAGWLEARTVEEIRSEFNVKPDFDPQEDYDLKHDGDWIHEDLLKFESAD